MKEEEATAPPPLSFVDFSKLVLMLRNWWINLKRLATVEFVLNSTPYWNFWLLKDESGYFWILAFFLGKVQNYGYTVSPIRWDTYFLVNRGENQKLNQLCRFGWVFCFQLGLRQIQALVRIYYTILIRRRRMNTLSFFHLLLILLLLLIIIM